MSFNTHVQKYPKIGRFYNQTLELTTWTSWYLLYDQTNFGTAKHNCWLLGRRVSRNTRKIRSRTHV